MNSRDISDLTPELQGLYHLFAIEMEKAGIPFMVTSTYRSQDEQDKLYAQGRTAPGKIVTWVQHSMHQLHRAFDIAICKDGKPCWDVKVDVNEDGQADYIEAANIGRTLGLKPGAFWHTPDYPHYES